MRRARLSALLVLVLIASLLLPVAAGAQEDLDGVLISETANQGEGGGFDNFIEITNYSDAAVDVSGWEVYRCFGSGSLSSSPQVPAFDGVVLGAGESYLLAHEDSGVADVADETYSSSLASSGYGVWVEDGDDELVDRMGAYGSGGDSDSPCVEGDALANDLSGDESFQRESDTGDNAADYAKAPRTVGDGDGDPGDIVLSEVATRGPDGAFDDFIMIENSGDGAVAVGGWTIARCSGSGNEQSPQVTIGSEVTLDAGEAFLAAHADGYTGETTPDATFSISLADSGGAIVRDADGAAIDSVGFSSDNDCTEGSPQSPLTSSEGADGLSHQRDGDTDDNAADFDKAARTVDGGAGDPGTGPSCDDPTAIDEINTVGDDGLPSTDMLDEDVAVEGVVTANFLDGLNAFFVQEEELDESVTDSQGIMVYAPAEDDDAVAVGDLVCVTGEVDEFSGTVQLSWAEIDVLDSGQDLPEIVQLKMPVDDRVELARLAGMRVDLSSSEGAMTVTQNYFQGQYGELDLSATGRLWNPTELYDPDDELSLVEAERDLNLRSWIKLDDGSSAQNPTPTPWLDNGAERAGAQTTDVIAGVTHYQHGAYRIQPTAPDDITFTNDDNPRPDGPPDVLAGAEDGAETITVAGFNVLNYFTTFGERGADDAEEFELQADKIVTAITKMDADVVGLMEIENNFGSSDDALEDLLDRLNDEAGAGTYAAHGHDAPMGNDAISTAIIYQPASVTPVGDLAVADHDAFVDPRDTGTERNRPAVTQAFEVSTGDRFVVAVNHLKSKGSGCGAGDDDQWQGNCNGTRTDAAEELVRWLSEDDPTGTGVEEIAIIGDLNAYGQEDPVQTILDAGYADTLGDRTGDVYTYVFDGEHGRLDHGLVSDALADSGWVVGSDVWHINTDEPSAFDYNSYNNAEDQDESEFRSSDHDPVIIGLAFDDDDVTGPSGPPENPGPPEGVGPPPGVGPPTGVGPPWR